jgi:DNA-binding SARP family transcriptional activator/predicted ATPase/Tfp pilus assembly protein PilF
MPYLPKLTINLLGGLTILLDNTLVTTIPTRKAAALLVYLACHRRPHQRETLADLFWDDLAGERALGNLRLTLNQLGKPFAPLLVSTRQTIALRNDVLLSLDTLTLERTLNDVSSTNEDRATALELYTGDFLQGFHLRDANGFSAWQLQQAEHWRNVALKGMRALLDYDAQRSNYEAGISWARRILALEACDEQTHRQLMQMLARSGQRHTAIRQYQLCREVLHQELGLEPEPATNALFERIQAMPVQRPAELPPRSGNLIGREAELARLREWLASPQQRLLSIVGPGGIGKTQLAISLGWKVALEYLGPCADGVFYTAFTVGIHKQKLIEDAELISLLAHGLKLSLSLHGSLLNQLVSHLAQKEVLLILDNGELLGPTARRVLSILVQQCESLRIIVLSRERLLLREEQLLELDGLAHPLLPRRALSPGQEQLTGSSLPAYAAVQWFMLCAQRNDSQLSLTQFNPKDQVAIGRLCQLVHGLPLAIELAAPWLSLQSPRELFAAISKNLNLLQTNMVDIPERHRSMRAVFSYSWQLLTEPMARALADLSIFPASFSAHAAEVIANVSLIMLGILRDRSLIKLSKGREETRYMLHPLLRSFAREQLEQESSAVVQLQAAHAHFFAALAQQQEGLLRGPESGALLLRLDEEFENLRSGWHWAVDNGDTVLLGQYSVTIHDLCATRGWELEGSQLFELGTSVVQERVSEQSGEAEIRAGVRVLSCSAELRYILGDVESAEKRFQTAHRLLASIAVEDSPELLFIYKQLALIAYSRGAYAQATSYLQLTLRIAEEEGLGALQADTLLSLGAVALAQGQWMLAEEVLSRSVSLYRTTQHEWGVGHGLRFLGALALARHDQQTAYAHLHESLTIARRIDNKIGAALTLDQLGVAYLAEQQLAKGEEVLQEALGLFRELGVELGIARTTSHLGQHAMARAEYEQAYNHFYDAMLIAQRLQALPLVIESLAGILHLCHIALVRVEFAPTLPILVRSLVLHPACSAETRNYIASFANDATARASDPGSPTAIWPLQQVCEWLVARATIPLQALSIAR